MKTICRIIISSALLMGLVSCNFLTPIPTEPPYEIKLELPITTKIPSPTFTPTNHLIQTKPTLTPTFYPTLSSQRPYFVFFADNFRIDSPLVIVDTNGGHRILTFPKGSNVLNYPLKSYISPDGDWFAFYTGSVWKPPYDLSLNMIHIPDGKVNVVSPLISDGFPDNLSPIVEEMIKRNPDSDCQKKSCWEDPVRFALIEGIQTVAWSPDGQYLAFSAQIDGPSSDLYIYNIEDGVIQRLTNDMESVGWIKWSQDGKNILFGNNIPGQVYTGSTLNVVKPLGEIALNQDSLLDTYWRWGGAGWLSPDLYLVSDFADGYGVYNLRSVNINNGQINLVWPYNYYEFAIDPVNKMIALSILQEEENYPEISDGLYFITFDGYWRKVSDMAFENLFFSGTEAAVFLGSNSEGTYSIVWDGTITHLSNEIVKSISPDRQLYILTDGNNLNLYSITGNMIHRFDNMSLESWVPDSSGLIVGNDNSLYYYSVLSETLILIDKCQMEDCSYCYYNDCAWLP